jgi:hydrogenase maturation protease
MNVAASLKTAILGFGNPVRSDDAAGIYVVNELQKKLAHRNDIAIFDMGTSAFEILFKLKEHQKIILIDAVLNSGEEDGTLFCLPANEINAQIQDDPMLFLHGMKWDQALSYAKKMMGNAFPENNIQVYLIAISEIKMEMQLSQKIKDAADKLIQTILREI